MSLASEFKQFAMRGNVVDMAVGIIIGGAFGKIVASLVNDVIMPPIGLLMGGVDFAEKKLILKAAVEGGAPAVELKYGLFINVVINFIIVAFAIFLMIKAMNAAKKKEEAKPAPAPAPTAEEKLLSEIRDLLRNK